jgi:hypothetical protein
MVDDAEPFLPEEAPMSMDAGLGIGRHELDAQCPGSPTTPAGKVGMRA